MDTTIITKGGRGLADRPPTTLTWLSARKWIPMEIASRGLKVFLRNPETKRTCELKYDLKKDIWVVRCFLMESLYTYCLGELEEWPHGEEGKYQHTMLNTYQGLEVAMEDFKKWSI